MNHAKTSFSTEILAGAIISVVQYLAPLRYLILACSKCHELFNHVASQCNYGACSSTAGDKAEFLYSAFDDT
jgi:hypothetical protein